MTAAPSKAPISHLVLFGATVLIAGGVILAHGLYDRAQAAHDLKQWTDDQAIQTVSLAKVEPAAAFRPLALPATIQPINRAAIFARVSGYLKQWNADIGTPVVAGQVLASIDTPDLDQQLDQGKADLVSAESNQRLAELTAKRWRALVASQSVSQQTVDEKTGDADVKKAAVDAAQANVRRLEALEAFKNVLAPFDGVVTARKTDIGALINAGSSGTAPELFEVSDLRKVRIYVQVPQAYTAELHPGLKASFVLPQYPGQQFDATLVSVSHAIDSGSRSMLVELQADNPDGKFSAGTYCTVEFQVPGSPGALILPATALVPVDKGVEVAVVGPDDKAALKPVTLGRDFGDSVEVVSGLAPSDRVIDNPTETLQTGDLVRVASAQTPAQPPAQAKAN
jgi:RND family efflux transporter MFP subunit